MRKQPCLVDIGRLARGLEGGLTAADTSLVPVCAAEEDGFGLIELLFAMVMLNIGILTLVAAFQTGTVALARSSSVSNGAAVADKTMEVYRGLKGCAIYLTAPTRGGADSAPPPVPNGIPNSTSSWYTRYSTDTKAY